MNEVVLCTCGEPAAEGFSLCEDCFVRTHQAKKPWDDPAYDLLDDYAPWEGDQYG